MKRQSRSYTKAEVSDLYDSSRFSLELTYPSCHGTVDSAEVEPIKHRGMKLVLQRFSYICTVRSSHGEYELDGSAGQAQRESISR